jgi:aspartyl-tRNA(Asn)/glutamyl-tRNA(Gln) amidotransferase subunit B
MTENKECKYKATIGLEIHAELKTKSKMFCSCKNDPNETKANVNVCPVCMGHPGTLPVLNKEAIKQVLRVGLACQSEIANFTEWDRKNYFYPDIPKGYQISQYKYPLVVGGYLHGVRLTRIHLEEDTASSSHEGSDFSLVDFNRSSVPLMELVTEPVIHSAKEASDFAKELQLLLQYLGAGDANLEKGEMRIEANVSVSDCEDRLGTKAEVKNLNSFRSVERAIAYEIERHIEVLESGGKIVQETRGWDEAKQKTYLQRIKEDSHDYRYFPEPDLPKLMVPEVFDLNALKKELPELPWERREKYIKIGIKAEDTETYVGNKDLSDYFEKLILVWENNGKVFSLSTASSFITSDYIGLRKTDPTANLPKPEHFAKLIEIFGNGKISSRVAKDLLARLVKENFDPEEIAEKEGLMQKNDEGELKIILEKIVAENGKIVTDYKAGKETAIMSLVGLAMKATKGSANPQAVKNILLTLLK